MTRQLSEKEKVNLVNTSHVKTGYDFLVARLNLIEDYPRLAVGTLYTLLYVHMNRNRTLEEISRALRVDTNKTLTRLASLGRLGLVESKGIHGLKGFTTTALAMRYLNQ